MYQNLNNFKRQLIEKSYSNNDLEKAKKQNNKVHKVMKEFKEGTLTSNGKKVTDRDQAIAIALNEAGLSKANYTEKQLEELISEHERLIGVMESPSKDDDKKEIKEQKEELKDYKKDLKKSFDVLGINLDNE